GIITAIVVHNLFENLHVLNMGVQLGALWACSQQIEKGLTMKNEGHMAHPEGLAGQESEATPLHDEPWTDEEAEADAAEQATEKEGFSLWRRLRSPHTLISFGIALAIIVFVFRGLNIDIQQTLLYMRNANIGLLLLGAVFTAIGTFASSISRDQIISFITAVFLCFILYLGFGSLANIDNSADWAYFVMQLGIDYHYSSMSKGLIDSRNVVYFVSVIVLMLLATKLVLDSRKW
ncbi:MAG: hypothetical protein HC912_11725, partial [Saprospiraceae bacterium]|nr:hypothetical protein [Saprospiraceae bacterium]